MATEQERNKALVLQMYDEVWNKGNLEFLDEALAPDFRDHPTKRAYDVPDRGRESLVDTIKTLRTAMPDFHDQMIRVVAEGDRVSYLGRMTGTHTGNYLRVPPSNNKVSVTGIFDFRLENGKIVERWGIFDVMGMMQQMGAFPPPAAGR